MPWLSGARIVALHETLGVCSGRCETMDTAAVLRDIRLIGQSYAVIVTAVALVIFVAGQLTWKLLTAITLVPLGALAVFFTVAYVLPRL